MKDYCVACGKKLSYGHKTEYCQQHYIEFKREQKIKNWLETGKTGYTVDTTIRGAIRDYILNEQNNQCAICGLPNFWNGKPLNFVLDHIDGDASNSCKSNLRLVCPNCDSQLDTYKSKNKNSSRTGRKEYLKTHTNSTIV